MLKPCSSFLSGFFHTLTIRIKRLIEEVAIHHLGGHAQEVAGLQCVVAVVVMRGVFEGQTALQVVLVDLHLCAHKFTSGNFLQGVQKSNRC